MLKRTKGRLLLTLLVITGMAGTLNVTSLSKQERKLAVSQLKETKEDLYASVKGLSEAQLNFRTAADRWSIRECVYHIVLTEEQLWNTLDSVMKLPADPEKRKEVKFSDEELQKGIRDRNQKNKAPETLQPAKAGWATAVQALEEFKKDRARHTKYVKTTTEDFRNRVMAFPFGSVDCYQFMLFITGHTARHTLQINEIKQDPAFPSR
ncbi:MAG TPA: DinB family protein [Chitinophagaceae bacterium]|nr:DinB family protein [Chitinophagaceae bacterium]